MLSRQVELNMRSAILTRENGAKSGVSFRNVLAWTSFGRLLHGLALWFMPLMLLKFLGQAEAGRFALAFAIATPLVVAFRLHLRSILATDVDRAYPTRDYYACTASMMLVAMISISVIAWLALDFKTGLLALIAACFLIVDSFSELTYGILQRAHRMDLVGQSLVIRGLLVIPLSALFIVGFRSTEWAVFSLSGVAMGVLLGRDWRLAHAELTSNGMPTIAVSPRQGDRTTRWPKVLELLGLGAPLGVTVLMMLLSEHATRYIVELFVSTEGLGIFATLLGVIGLGNVVCSSIAQTILPRLTQYLKEGNRHCYLRQVVKASTACFTVGLLGIAAVFLFGETFMRWLLSNEGSNYQSLLMVLALCGMATYVGQIAGTAVVAMRRFWLPLPVHFLTLIATIIAAYYLVPSFGLLGAAWTQLVSIGVRLALFSVFVAWAASSHAHDGGIRC